MRPRSFPRRSAISSASLAVAALCCGCAVAVSPAAVRNAEALLAALPPLGATGVVMDARAADAAEVAVEAALATAASDAVRRAATGAEAALRDWRAAATLPNAELARDAIRDLALVTLAATGS